VSNFIGVRAKAEVTALSPETDSTSSTAQLFSA
jgi:hypothetical protein